MLFCAQIRSKYFLIRHKNLARLLMCAAKKETKKSTTKFVMFIIYINETVKWQLNRNLIDIKKEELLHANNINNNTNTRLWNTSFEFLFP